jgi:hypothetical protein
VEEIYDGTLRSADDGLTLMARSVMNLAAKAKREGKIDHFIDVELPYIIQASTNRPVDPNMIHKFRELIKPPQEQPRIFRYRGKAIVEAPREMSEDQVTQFVQKELGREIRLSPEPNEGNLAAYRINL